MLKMEELGHRRVEEGLDTSRMKSIMGSCIGLLFRFQDFPLLENLTTARDSRYWSYPVGISRFPQSPAPITSQNLRITQEWNPRSVYREGGRSRVLRR